MSADRVSLQPPPPPPSRADSPSSSTSPEPTCLQSPVNSSGVRIVIDSDDDNGSVDCPGDRPWLRTDAQFDQPRLPDGPEIVASSRSASITSGSGDDDSSNEEVSFHCGPIDDAEEDSIAEATSGSENTSGCRSAAISDANAAHDAKSGAEIDASGLNLLSDSII